MSGTSSTQHKYIMFNKKSAFLKFILRTPPQQRKKSDTSRALYSVYAVPPQIFPGNKRLNDGFARLYWAVRSLQFRLFFRHEGGPNN
ncbi:hypothetical protein niasHT_032941 [Heterodera trifolii]|uniref:Uncharacterized protein n=1 Tax=Heterodera trifolii TaxID=157864 RepID=A0ABD2J4L1_9BILA